MLGVCKWCSTVHKVSEVGESFTNQDRSNSCNSLIKNLALFSSLIENSHEKKFKCKDLISLSQEIYRQPTVVSVDLLFLITLHVYIENEQVRKKRNIKYIVQRVETIQ